MKNLVRLTIFNKVFYTTPGTEISIEGQRVYFIPKNGGYVFVDCVKFLNGTSSYNSETHEMTGRINTPCIDVISKEVIECHNQISLIDGKFKLSGLDADSNRITCTLMPKSDTSLVEMFIAENPDLNDTLAGLLRANPTCFDFIYESGREILPSTWIHISSLMQEDEDLDMILGGSLGKSIANTVMEYIKANK